MLSANKILLKRSNDSGRTPVLSSLDLGELGLNTIDGRIFAKTFNGSFSSIVSFLNSDDYPYTLNHYYSSVNFNYGNNTVSQIYASVLGGYNNDISGGGSSVINGEDNDISGDFSLIGAGLKNKINASGDYSFIAAGSGNLINHSNVFTLGSNLSSHASNFTYVNNISAQGILYGDGSGLTNLAAAAAAPDTEVRALTANWQSTYTTVSSNSSTNWNNNLANQYTHTNFLPLSGGTLTGTFINDVSATGSFYGDGSKLTNINASYITSGTLSAARLPTFNGDITANTSNGSVSATVVAIQGSPISVQTPSSGQALQWNGTAWTPGAIPNGGSGGGGLVYYLNFANEAQTPTTNLSATPNTPKELGITGIVGASSYTLNNVSTTTYDLICGFVSLTASPNTTVIPAGLWDFNIWAESTSTTTNQMILKLDVYKYDGSNIPTLLASSGDIYLYDPNTPSQYIASVVFPQTTLLTTDRIYIELRAKATKNNKDVTIYFGGTTPTHVHTTFPSVGGSGLLKVINGVYQSPASLLVNTDVAANAAIDQSKINGLTDVASKANSVYTTVQSNSSSVWNYQGTDIKALTGDWINGNLAYTTIQSNSAAWNLDNSTDTEVRSLTSNWNSTYSTLSSLSSNWDSTYTNVQSNSANWQTAYAYVSANSVNLTATNIFVNNNLTVTNTVSAKYFQGTLIDWMTLVRGYKTTPTLLATIGTGEVYTYVYATTASDKTYYRYIATNGSEDSFYGNFTNPTLSNLIATKKIIL